MQPGLHFALAQRARSGWARRGAVDHILRRLGKCHVPEFALGVPVELKDLDKLFAKARELTSHQEFVVVGSISILGVPATASIPERMTMSNDIDAYTKGDPGRIMDLQKELGQGSAFEMENGYYLDPVSPSLPTLPEGWVARLFRVERKNGIVLYFLDPNDAAVSKYARSEPRDREWLRAGIAAGILSPATIEYRMRETSFLDDQEKKRAHEAFREDRASTPPTSPRRPSR